MPYAQQVMRARMDQVTVAAGSTAVLQIVTASSPETILATFNLNNPIAGPATGVDGLLTLSGFPKTVAASGTGTATFARIRTGGSVVVVSGMTVGTSIANDVEVSSTSFNTGQTITLNSATIQHASIALPPPAGIASGTNLHGLEYLPSWDFHALTAGQTLSTLQDIFTTLDVTKWTETNDSGCDSTIASSQLSQGIHATAVGYTTITSVLRSTIIGAAIYTKFVQPVQGTFSGIGVECIFEVMGHASTLNKIFFLWTSGDDLAAQYNNDNGLGNINVANATYNSTNHKWLRIREDAGTIFFETQPEGGPWTTFGSMATSLITWNLADCHVVYSSGRWQAQGTASGAALWDGLNSAVAALTPLSLSSVGRFDALTYNNVNQIAVRDETISYLASQNFQKHRLPLRWELLQPILASTNASLTTRNAYSPSITSNGALYTNYRDRITSVLDAHAAVGSRCILALRAGCRYVDFVYDVNGNVTNLTSGSQSFQPFTTSGQGVQRVFGGVGSSALSEGDFVDFWSRVSAHWGNNWNGTGLPHPGLGGYSLMDEAYDLGGSPESLTIWPTYAAAAVSGIRVFDIVTPIYICGNSHAYASLWATVNPSFPLAGSNLIYEARQFLDFPGTGIGYNWTHEASNGATTSTGLNGVTVFGNWLASNSSKGAISELALPLDGTSDANQANWNTSFLNVLNYCRPRNIELYTAGGGSHWVNQGAAVSHQTQFYQSKPYESLVSGLLKNSFSIAKATLFDSGTSYWDPGASGGVPDKPNNIDFVEIHRKPVPSTSASAGPTLGLQPPPSAPTQPTGLSTFTTAQLNTILGAGTTVSVADGIYTITAAINVVNNHNISATNARRVIFKVDPAYTGQIINEVSTNFTLTGIILDGNYVNRTAREGVVAASLIQIQGCAVTINNCVLQNAPSYGIWSYNAPSAPQITNNEFYECWHPIIIDGNNVAGAGGLIQDNKFLNTTALKSLQGVELLNCKSPVIRHNVSKGIGFLPSTSTPFEGRWGDAFFIWLTDAPLFEENTCYEGYWSGLVYGQSCTNGITRHNYILEGNFVNAHHAAWYEQSGNDVQLIENNYFDGAVLVGDAGGNHLTIINNIFRSDIVGLDVSDNAVVVRIEGNDIRSKNGSPSNNGILLWNKTASSGNDIKIFNNNIQGFTRAIDISSPGNTGAVFGIQTFGNTYSGNTTNGVFFEGSIFQTIALAVTQTQQKIQAESGTKIGTLTNATTIGGYEGSGYVKQFTDATDELLLDFTSVENGSYMIRVRYANDDNQAIGLAVEGNADTEPVLPDTNNTWTNFDSSIFRLENGTMTIGISALGSAPVGSLTFTLGARGNITSNVVISVTSNAGGTITSSPVTLTAGANPTSTFTFIPASADLLTTLTYAITSGAQPGMLAPPSRKIYSHTNPVALSATNLPVAGQALLAKYSAALWTASDAYTDYQLPSSLSTSGSQVRAICDSANGSTYKSPMELVVFGNLDNNYGNHSVPLKGLDGNGKHYASFSNLTWPLWCRKSAPIANINPVPYNKMPFNLADNHFMIATCLIEQSTGGGTVIEASNSEVAGNLSRISIDSSSTTGSGGFPDKIVAVYYESYFGGVNPSLTQVPLEFNVIYLFHARFNLDNSGAPVWPFGADVTPTQIQTVRTRGQKVILTVGGDGGAGFKYIFANRTQSTAFVNGIISIISTMGGIDGVDFDNYEGIDPTETFIVEMIWIAQQLKLTYGPNFAITTPSGANSVPDRNLAQRMFLAGALTWAAPQFYAWSGFKDVGFISNRLNDWVGALGATQVVMGVAAGNYDTVNSTTLAESVREWDIAVATNPTLRGVFAWSALYNFTNGNQFGTTFKAKLNAATGGSSMMPRVVVGPTTITGTIMNAGQAYTLTLVGKTGAGGQRFRVDGVENTTVGNADLSTSYKYNQVLVGGGFSNNTMTFSNQMRVFAAAVGAGAPTTSELAVMEKYVATFGGASTSGVGTVGGPIPFGSRADGNYSYGISVSTKTNAQKDAVCKSYYNSWKAMRVKTGIPAAPGQTAQWPAIPDGKYVDFGTTVNGVSVPNATILYVSEGIGYGMLLSVLFAGHDASAQSTFDGLLKTARGRYAYNNVVFGGSNGLYLMNWRCGKDGAVVDNTDAGQWGGGGWNAMDGDMDMAQALLMAHRQWGSAGTWNYLQEAVNTIGAIKSLNMRVDGTCLSVANASRISDFMFGHFRSWKAATGDSFWDLAVSRSYFLANRMQTIYSASAGLVPDFIMGTTTATPFPSTGGFGNGDGNFLADRYWYNSCRCPMRWAADYVWSGDANVLTLQNRLNAFFYGQTSSGTNIDGIKQGYFLDGTPAAAGGGWIPFVSPITAGAMTSSTYQALLNNGWAWNEIFTTSGYFDAELQLLSMVVASGNWWRTT